MERELYVLGAAACLSGCVQRLLVGDIKLEAPCNAVPITSLHSQIVLHACTYIRVVAATHCWPMRNAQSVRMARCPSANNTPVLPSLLAPVRMKPTSHAQPRAT